MSELPPTNDNVISLSGRKPIERSEGSTHSADTDPDDTEIPCAHCGLYHFSLFDIIDAAKHQTRRAINDGTRSITVHVEDMQEILAHLDFLNDEVNGDDD